MRTEKLLSGLGWRVGGVAALLLLVIMVYALVAIIAAFNGGLGL